VVSYVLAVQEKMATMAELVKNNLVKSQREQKWWYDQAGDQVLVLLLVQWQGPYPVFVRSCFVSALVSISSDS